MKGNKLKYHEKWAEYGFITETELLNQIKEFNKGEDPHSEHYRYKSFQNFIQRKENFSDSEISNYIELVELDIDQGMASSALAQLFVSKKLNPKQLKNVGNKLKTYGAWAEKIVSKMSNKTMT